MIRALLLDLDNTLVDRDAAFERVIQAWFPGEEIGDLRALDGGGRGERGPLWRSMMERRPGRWADAQALQRELGAAIAEAVRPDPVLLKALAQAAGRYRLALVSNGGSSTQRRKIERAGIGPSLEVILISEEIGLAKPDPRIFRAALAALGVAPEEGVMIGDDPERDVQGARACGISARLVTPERPFLWLWERDLSP